MKFRLLRRLSLLLGLLAILGILAVACGEEEEKAPSPAATTPAASPTPAAAKIGGAGIPSEPRQVRGLEGILTLDDGLAAWKERPANEDRTGVTADTITLGRASGVTGVLASYEKYWGPALQAFIKRVNEAGGIHGRKLKLITRDDQHNPTLAIQVYRELVEKDKVFAIFNAASTPSHPAVCDYLDEKNVISWGPMSGDAKCFYPARPTQFSLWNGPDEQLGLGIAESILSETPDAKVANVYMTALAGSDVNEGLKWGLEKGGGQLVAAISFDPMATDLTPQAVQAAAAKPDWVVHAMAPEVGLFSLMRALREVAGYTGKIYWTSAGGVSAKNSEILDGTYYGVGPDKNGLKDPNDPAIIALKKLVEEEGAPWSDLWTPSHLVFTEMLVRALEIAGPDLTREGLMEAIYLAMDGSWKCSVCGFPRIYTPEDPFLDGTVQLARWNHAKQELEILGPLVEYETSKGTGVVGNMPGPEFECQPPSAEHPKGTCPWKSQ